MYTFTKFGDFRPTVFDTIGLGSEGKQDWLVMPFAQNRDSNTVERSNFHVLEREFLAIDPSQDYHYIHHFSHWGPGWFEICVFQDHEELKTRALEMIEQMKSYIILDEDHWLNLEMEEGNDFEEDSDDAI